MGEHRNNPRSQQASGPLPEAFIDGGFKVEIEPKKAWVEMMRPIADEAREKGLPEPSFTLSEEDKEVVFYLQANWTVPMRTAVGQWPQAQIRLVEIYRMPLVELKGRVRDAFAKTNPAMAATIDPPRVIKSPE